MREDSIFCDSLGFFLLGSSEADRVWVLLGCSQLSPLFLFPVSLLPSLSLSQLGLSSF
jgi:hypothetical protein